MKFRSLLALAAFTSIVSVPRIDAATITIETGFTGDSVSYHFDPIGTSGFTPLGTVTMDSGAGFTAPFDFLNGLGFFAYCVDIVGPIFFPDEGSNGIILPNLPATYLASASSMALWTETYGLPAAGARAAYLYDTFAAGATADTARTALQMAIWNVLYDTDNSVTSGAGTFYVAGELDGSNPITAAANAYLSSIPVDLTGYSATWLQLTYCNAQNQCTDAQDFVGPGPVLSQVTESSSFALFSLSLVALAAAFVRKSRSSAISLPTSPKA